jgi:hypothetical protein
MRKHKIYKGDKNPMKRIALLLLVAFATMAFANPFSDVKFNSWAYDAVTKLAAKGIITGYPDGTFKGNKPVTRYDMAVMIARLMEKMPTMKTKMSKGDMDSVQKLVVEFADELSLLGVKVTALEDEMSAVKDDLATVKEDVKTLKMTGGNGGKVRISGDIRMRFKDFDYDSDAANDAFNRNFFQDRLGLNFNMMIDPDVTAFLRLEKFSYWNTQNGDWANGTSWLAKGNDPMSDTDLRTALAYVNIKDFFGWADQIRFGRQHFSIAHNLLINGVGDGIYAEKKVGTKNNVVARVAALKNSDDNVDGVTTISNEGLDMIYTDWTFDLNDIMAEVYYMSMSNPYTTNSTTNTNLATALAGRYDYYGLALSGNPTNNLSLWGEYTWLRADNSVNLYNPSATLVGNDDSDTAYLVGLSWDMNKKCNLTTQYTDFENYFFRPSNLWNIDTYLDPSEDYLYDAMGYQSNFDDLMAKLTYKWSEKSTIKAIYESIDDNQDYGAAPQDDRDVITGVYSYQYKPNTKITFLYRSIDAEDNNTKSVANGNPVGFAGDNYGNVNTVLTPATTPATVVDDVQEYRLQLDVNF